jgi:hypothetical protein
MRCVKSPCVRFFGIATLCRESGTTVVIGFFDLRTCWRDPVWGPEAGLSRLYK